MERAALDAAAQQAQALKASLDAAQKLKAVAMLPRCRHISRAMRTTSQGISECAARTWCA